MVLLNIFNQNILLIAETLAIVIGSMLMGILLSYLHWGGIKKKVTRLSNSLDLERDQAEDLKTQVKQLQAIKGQLQSQISDAEIKHDAQAKKIFDQQQELFDRQQLLTQLESHSKSQKTSLDELNSTIDTYQHRLRIIEEELLQTKNVAVPLKKAVSAAATRANYDHVSKLLGRQVTENDLTLITGIGPKTASLLQANGIKSWDKLAESSLDFLQKILTEAGGVYKSIDPSHWSKQALMAAKSEWRKLRVFQETLKNNE